MASRREFFEKTLRAIAASKTPRTCADAIMQFVRTISPADQSQCLDLLNESPLGGAIAGSGLMTGLDRFLSPGAKTQAGERGQPRSAQELLERIIHDLIGHYERIYNPAVGRERCSLARSYLSLWERLYCAINAFSCSVIRPWLRS